MRNKLLFAGGALLWILLLIFAVMHRNATTYTPNMPPRPDNATIKITNHRGDVWWTNAIDFNESQDCVVFTALPTGTNTVICGSYRMEGLQGQPPPKSS